MNMQFPLSKLTLALVLCGSSQLALANFDFCSGSGSNGGSGSFKKTIAKAQTVYIGELPSGVKGIDIRLKASNDLDVELYDKQSGTKIVGWLDGILSSGSLDNTIYQGMNITWSGFNGDGTGLGNEYITINSTNRPLLMKAFGYEAGEATVNYSWQSSSANGCQIPAQGGGTFQQTILPNATVKVGDIPPGVENLYVKLKSSQDVDIELYDKQSGKKIVGWQGGILNSGSLDNTTYQGMNITWSGYNGDGSGRGNEYIKITGKTTRDLTLKAYGYRSGHANVEYSWGSNNAAPVPPATNPLASAVDAFVQNKKGKCTDMDGYYGCQCVDLMHSYIQDVLGVPRSAHNIRGNAYPLYNGLPNPKTISSGSQKVSFEKIPNTISAVPKKGDIIFWKPSSSNGYVGHVAIFLNGDVNNFTSLDQNWFNASLSKGSSAAVVNHDYNGIAGWLRPTILSGSTTGGGSTSPPTSSTPSFSLISQGHAINAYNPKNSSNVNMWSYSTSDSDQRWVTHGNNLKRYGTNYCLNAHNPSNNSNVTLYTCNTNDSEQQWDAVSCNSSSYCLVKLIGTSFCLNAHSPYDGSNLNMWKCNASDPEQRFKMITQ